MRKIAPLTYKALLITFLSLLSCKEQVVDPVNIFEQEELNTETAVSYELEGLGAIYINENRIETTENGVNIKGTVFTDSESGLIPISSGDFSLSNMKNGAFQSFEGYGLNELPKTGLFKEFQDLVSPGSYYNYLLGSQIKETFPDAPVQDKTYYFQVKLEEAFSDTPQLKVKNTSFGFEQVFFDPRDPSIYFEGEMNVSGKTAIDNLGFGLSANGLLEFTPYEYSEELINIMIRPLEPINGNIYLKGEIPLEQYQIKIVGDAIVGLILNNDGSSDFFNEGIKGGEFRMGVNGAVYVDSKLIDVIPADLALELGRSTLIVNLEQEGENYLQVAGQMNSSDFLKAILSNIGAEPVADYLTFPNSLFEVYAYVGDDLENSQFYVSNTISMAFPGIGEQELAKAILEITYDYVYAEGRMQIPGVGGVKLGGNFEFDGDFELTGSVNVEIDAELARFELELNVVVTNSGVAIIVDSAVCVLGDECIHIGVDIEVDWINDSFTVCGDVPGLGEVCGTL